MPSTTVHFSTGVPVAEQLVGTTATYVVWNVGWVCGSHFASATRGITSGFFDWFTALVSSFDEVTLTDDDPCGTCDWCRSASGCGCGCNSYCPFCDEFGHDLESEHPDLRYCPDCDNYYNMYDGCDCGEDEDEDGIPNSDEVDPGEDAAIRHIIPPSVNPEHFIRVHVSTGNNHVLLDLLTSVSITLTERNN